MIERRTVYGYSLRVFVYEIEKNEAIARGTKIVEVYDYRIEVASQYYIEVLIVKLILYDEKHRCSFFETVK